MVCLAKNYNSPAGEKRVLSAKTISEKEGIPFEFLEKIILKLEKAKLVRGKKGVQGGYILFKSPKMIRVNDIVSSLEENKKSVDCALCGRKKGCLTKNVWSKVNFALNKTLKSITLQNLIK